MDREKITLEFYIEDHATLFALIAREAITKFGGEGMSAIVRAISAYGIERGSRSAKRCLSDGEKLSMENYILYGEWHDPRGESKTEIVEFEPNYRTNVVVCGWCEAWKKRGLLEYGQIYCDHVDEYLVRGFNPELRLEMGKILSHGDCVCEFNWIGCHFRDSVAAERKRRGKISLVTRDFLYHCGHLLASARREIIFELGVIKGEKIISGALLEYKKIFGALKNKSLIEEAGQNFLPFSV
jgi:hypothetical protein